MEPRSQTQPNLIITGTGTGLGKHLLTTLGGVALDRRNTSHSQVRADVIIHSAWPARAPESSEGLQAYVQDTIELTRQLTQFPHRKFIFISTAEVYPIKGHSGREDESIPMGGVRNLYAHCKLIAESIVHVHAMNCLVLRVVGLLGPTARANSLIRVLRGDPAPLTVSRASRFYYILHRDVSAFIRLAIENNLLGTYNVCSTASITLGEVAEEFGRTMHWGSYAYDVGHVDNCKIVKEFPQLNRSSLEVIREFSSSL